MKKKWYQITLNLKDFDPLEIESVFLDQGSISISYSDKQDTPIYEPAPGETPFWENTLITALFNDPPELEQISDALTHKLKLKKPPYLYYKTLTDRKWELEWKKNFSSMQFGEKLWVIPFDQSAPEGENVIIRINPGLAFGSGTHATTTLCLNWLDKINIKGKNFYDFGCGSGILSIAALKLGASKVVACDIDPQAIQSSKKNAIANDVGEKLILRNEINNVDGPYDIIIANILSNTLIENVEIICQNLRPGGKLGMSGILSNQIESVINIYSKYIKFSKPMN